MLGNDSNNVSLVKGNSNEKAQLTILHFSSLDHYLKIREGLDSKKKKKTHNNNVSIYDRTQFELLIEPKDRELLIKLSNCDKDILKN